MSLFTDLLANKEADRVYLLEVVALDKASGSPVTVLASSGNSKVVYNGAFYAAILDAAFNFQTQIFSNGVFVAGNPNQSFGAITMFLGSGEHDYLTGYDWVGRDVTLRMGGTSFLYADFGVIFKGTIGGVLWDETHIELSINDYSEILNKPLQTVTYAGTGGVEGSADVAGQAKPLSFGRGASGGFAFTESYLNPKLIDAANQVYAIGESSITACPIVNDRGVGLDIDADVSDVYAWTPVAGHYVTAPTQALIRLGAIPNGMVDAQVNATSITDSTVANIVKSIVEVKGGLSNADIDTASFDALNADTLTSNRIETVWFFDPSTITVADAINQILDSVGCYSTWSIQRTLIVEQFMFRSPSAVLNSNIISAKRTNPNTSAANGASLSSPWWRLTSQASKIYASHTEQDISTLIGGSTRQWLTQQYARLQVASDPVVLASYPLAQDIKKPCGYADDSPVAQETARQLDLMKVQRDIYEIVIVGWQFLLRVGKTITVQYSRFSLNKDMIILGIAEETTTNTTTLTVWG